ncbi:MAG: transcription repressor NadR [Cellulosilyticaceae bacterium]
MDGQDRRAELLKILNVGTKPVSGVALGKKFGISRQVVVQDVALLRAEGYDILATARGYILNKEAGHLAVRMISVKHDEQQLQDELNTIVDNGGRVKNVIISHSIYGDVVGDLMLKNRRDVQAFVAKVKADGAPPLSNLTDGVHIHTIEAANEEELDIIEEELRKKGYLYSY